jgi:hypothetical protein
VPAGGNGDVGQVGDVGHDHSQAEPPRGGNPNRRWSCAGEPAGGRRMNARKPRSRSPR